MWYALCQYLSFFSTLCDNYIEEDSALQLPLTSGHTSSFCKNSPTSRNCWGHYDTSTNYYTTTPNTGNTVEYWLSAEDSICNQDGYRRPCYTFNGSIPGPTIVADWGDNVIVHVTNNMKENGTAVHWHGVRMWDNVQNDGVPGVTQCAIAPGDTLSYKFRATQYGTSWYHSHFSLQYTEGLFGAIVFNGPATADYEVDLGPLILQDWSHTPIFTAWAKLQEWGITHVFNNLLINGTNTYDCSNVDDVNCLGDGKKFELSLQPGKKHLLRLVNVAADSQFRFSIDGHSLRVIASDFVPIKPYNTDVITISSGQRYDIIIEANAVPDNYWMRGGWVSSKYCFGVANEHPEDMTGIVRYDVADTRVPLSSSSISPPETCADEPKESLVPYMSVDVSNLTEMFVEDFNVKMNHKGMFKWTVNSTALEIDWAKPTLQKLLDGKSVFPTEYNVLEVEKGAAANDEWAVLVIEDAAAGFFAEIAHPIHMHGHDFWILAQEEHSKWDGTARLFKTSNPPRRDTALLPKGGWLAIAFKLDNPGVWLVHCHIAWHASQGLALEFVESASAVSVGPADMDAFNHTCSRWSKWWSESSQWPQEDSGI